MSEENGGTVLAFPQKGMSTDNEVPLSAPTALQKVSLALRHIATAARYISESALDGDEKRQAVAELGLIAARIGQVQVEVLDRERRALASSADDLQDKDPQSS